ncbi:MAG: nitronate monooxygenase, partial [Proteobacteria bacterium]|nr:nitronate monooxygenase [Pseudomonadota bacterium]
MPQTIIDIYLPRQAKVEQIVVENSHISTFILAFSDKQYNDTFRYQPGQFMMVSMPHCGEAPISISSTPTRTGTIHLSVRKAGKLTNGMHGLRVGDTIGLRGPYGRPFPMRQLTDRDLLFVAGGIGRGEMIASYLEMGASGVQLGTRFACASESIAHPAFKQAFFRANA